MRRKINLSLNCRVALVLLGILPWLLQPAIAQHESGVQEQINKRTEEMLRRLSSGGQAPGKESLPGLEQALYQYLISEIAGQRGRAGIAIQGMTDLARKLQDPRLARRALEIAFQNRQLGDAMEAATLWIELEPQSALARQAMSVLLANSGSLEAATKSIAALLADRDKAPALYLEVNRMLGRFSDKKAVLGAVQELAKARPDLAQSHFAVASAAAAAREVELAMREARQSLLLDGNFQQAAVLLSQLLREQGREASLAFLREHLARHPEASEVRLAYARLLVSQRDLVLAREEFLRLEKASPRDPEFSYALGLISMQQDQLADADAAFQRTLSSGLRDRNPVLLSLGQLEERRKDWSAALRWYGQVSGSDYFVSSKLRMASVLTKQLGLEEGRKFLQAVKVDTEEQRVQLVLAEAQLLRDAKEHRNAYVFLSEQLAQSPDSTEFLYDRAMIAEKLGDVVGLEQDLRRVIQLKPDHAHAYNALGYTLADRTTRFEEANELIQKAIALSPEDAFILDSLGWVQFRQGKISEALKTLTKAYSLRSDPEIAAHLGEVLWASGSREDAAQLWRAALSDNPGNEAVSTVLQRFLP